MNNSSTNLLLKKRYNLIFSISLFIISLGALVLIIFTQLINPADSSTLLWPVPFLLLPIYLIVRLIFLKMESSKNIGINKIEEIAKTLLFVYCLTFISVEFFPLSKKLFEHSLTVTFFSFILPKTSFTTKAIIRHLITNFVLFIPLGFLLPIINTKFRSMLNCAIIGLLISIIISVLDISLNFLGLDILNITSFDIVVINVIGTLIGCKLYYFILNK